jgi:hypothetical protein
MLVVDGSNEGVATTGIDNFGSKIVRRGGPHYAISLSVFVPLRDLSSLRVLDRD